MNLFIGVSLVITGALILVLLAYKGKAKGTNQQYNLIQGWGAGLAIIILGIGFLSGKISI